MIQGEESSARSPEEGASRPVEDVQQSPAIRLLAQRSARADNKELRLKLPSHDDDDDDDDDDEDESQKNKLTSSSDSRLYYTSAQWTTDGTSLITTSSDQTVSSFVLPADLLQPAGEARTLQPQASIKLPEPTQVVAAAPYFSLAEPTSQLLLVGCRDHPLQVYHAFPKDARSAPLTSYKLIKKESEQYITPASLLWEYPGTHFVCGSANRLDYFDMSQHGSGGPLLTVPTIPSRRHILKGGGVGMKGTVAALAASPRDANGGSVLAAGTWTRWMGLYDLHRTDRVIAHWSISNAEAGFQVSLGGQGIVQTAWSPCGRYLVINERQAEGLLVYDIRGTGQLLSVLKGRRSNTQQRLHCDVFQGETGFEVWAGSQDGSVAVWEGVGSQNDVVEPSWTWKAHDSPIGSTIIHSSGSVVATCSGGWGHPSGGDDSADKTHDELCNGRVFDESSIKVWSIEGSTEPDS
ncbi:Guanine nucleotide-binding negative regulator 1-like protein [Cladobotryum mycophilum]|uniref:Guanine nucleotide-binding negative regulator 1-like protein n=1 Tax=Cladobotryum mycophilum TaxID=491253 RepID=A0ABR0S835_9HYPO